MTTCESPDLERGTTATPSAQPQMRPSKLRTLRAFLRVHLPVVLVLFMGIVSMTMILVVALLERDSTNRQFMAYATTAAESLGAAMNRIEQLEYDVALLRAGRNVTSHGM
jgi:CHASE1-domain containing sensor protein